MKLFFLVFFLTILFVGSLAEKKKSDVIPITVDNFSQLGSGTWMLKLYAPWCGFCRRIKPDWIEFAENLKGSETKVAELDGAKNPCQFISFMSSFSFF